MKTKMAKKKITHNEREFSGELPDDLLALLVAARPVEEALADLAADPLHLDEDADFECERLKADIVEQVLRAMEEQGVNRSDLAERLGKSRQWVSRVLNEGDNFTVATVARLSCALGLRATIAMAPRVAAGPQMVVEERAARGLSSRPKPRDKQPTAIR